VPELIFTVDESAEPVNVDQLTDLVCDLLLDVTPALSGGGEQWIDLNGDGKLRMVNVA
jgi:hypothetical protein